MKDVKQLNLTAGKQTLFEMKLKRSQFLVKNFTSNQITVKLGDNDSYSVIGAGSWERVFNNVEDKTTGMAEATNIVKITPIETDLTQEEIKDYQSFVTYDGTTIIKNDAECYTKITYMAKGN